MPFWVALPCIFRGLVARRKSAGNPNSTMSLKKLALKDVDVKDKRVLIRVDLYACARFRNRDYLPVSPLLILG